jgi:hypothetical protein
MPSGPRWARRAFCFLRVRPCLLGSSCYPGGRGHFPYSQSFLTGPDPGPEYWPEGNKTFVSPRHY